MQRAGNDLRALIDYARITPQSAAAARRARSAVSMSLEQAAIAGLLNPAILDDPEQLAEAARLLARAGSMRSRRPAERGWRGEATERRLHLHPHARTASPSATSSTRSCCKSAEARRLDERTGDLQEVYAKPGKLVAKDKEFTRQRPVLADRCDPRARPQGRRSSSATKASAR